MDISRFFAVVDSNADPDYPCYALLSIIFKCVLGSHVVECWMESFVHYITAVSMHPLKKLEHHLMFEAVHTTLYCNPGPWYVNVKEDLSTQTQVWSLDWSISQWISGILFGHTNLKPLGSAHSKTEVSRSLLIYYHTTLECLLSRHSSVVFSV